MTASATSLLDLVRKATPAERADVLTELLNSDLGSAADTRVLKLPSATGKSEVIYLAVNRSRPPQTLPPKLTEEELAELRIRIEKQGESVDLETLMNLVEREVARRTAKS